MPVDSPFKWRQFEPELILLRADVVFGESLESSSAHLCHEPLPQAVGILPRAQDTQERSMYFFSMVSTLIARMDRARDFAG